VDSRRWLQVMSAVCVGLLVANASMWVLQRIAPTLWLFAAGFAVAYVLDPLLDRLEARGWSRGQAVGLVTVAFACLLFAVGAWGIPALVSQTQHLVKQWPQYNAEIVQAYESCERWSRAYLSAHFPDYDVMAFVDQKMTQVQVWAQERLPTLLRFVSDTLLASVSFLGLLFMVVFIALNFMLFIDPFRRSIRAMLSKETGDDVADIGRRVNAMLGQYLRGQATMCLIMGSLATLALFVLGRIFGTQYGLVVGVLAGVVYVVPWIGAFLTNVIAIIIGYITATHDPVLSAVCAMAAMTTINFVCDNILTPRVLGREVGLHPLVIIFALMAGVQLLGIPGMIIATPAAATIKIILARWLPLLEVETKPGKAAPLAFDLQRAAHMVLSGLGRVTGKIEDAVGLARESDEAADDKALRPAETKTPPTDT
jgi:predicted PurR-regulated permease PerM